MKGAALLLEALQAEGVDTVFGYPGGAILPVYDALVDSAIRHILTRHEQAAAFAADGYARSTGRAGVCMATSGPGATNLLTGFANAFLDSVPMVAITGQVATPLLGTDAFQEVDTFGMSLPVVKHSFIVRSADDVPHVVAEAFRIAQSGRPGPVLIDLPKDVASTETTAVPTPGGVPPRPPAPLGHDIERAIDLLRNAVRPVVYAGGGVGIGGAVDVFRRFVEATGIPTVTTLKGLGAIPTDHPLAQGMLGMHGSRAANFAVQEADLLVCVGARFDDRATGRLDGFAPRARVVHLDVDESEIGKLRGVEVALAGDLRVALERMTVPLAIDPWRRQCARWREEHAWRYDAPGEGVYGPSLLRDLSHAAGDDLVLTCDVGQHQMWVAQHCRIPRPSAHHTSGGLGAMGYGLPAAIGAKLARPEATVIAVSGDGSFMMNIQELVTLRRYGLGVKIVLLDNAMLGMVRQWQDLFHDQRQSEVDLWDNPDFVEVGKAMGIAAFRVDRRRDVPAAIDRLLSEPGPVLAHVKIDPKANVWPLVPPGASNSTMLDAPSEGLEASNP